MNKIALFCLITLAVLAAGCPYNNYEVTLTPRGDVMERTLVFYRWDDDSSPGKTPGYVSFDPEQLASITSFYPQTGVTNDGDRHTVRGEFRDKLPGDIGGAGWYRNLSTSLGDAGFYVERLRGNDDLLGTIEKKLQTADQLTDLIIGWSTVQFESEPGFEQLHQFLNHDFRHDLKNLVFYMWVSEDFKSEKSNEDLLIRFWQYLIEREYVEIKEVPGFIRGWQMDDEALFCQLLQRLIARKLGISDEQPLPQSLEFIADPEAVENSLQSFLALTDSYQIRLRGWEENRSDNPDVQKPDPIDVVQDLINDLYEIHFSNESQSPRLTVKLSLLLEPLRTNGKWDETNRQVVWESPMEGKTHTAHLPMIYYADWVAPQEDFQKAHFGSVSLTGEELLNYCLWRTSLEEKKAVEWEQFLAKLKPGADAIDKLNDFQFTGEAEQIDDDEQKNDSDMGKELIEAALQSSAVIGDEE